MNHANTVITYNIYELVNLEKKMLFMNYILMCFTVEEMINYKCTNASLTLHTVWL